MAEGSLKLCTREEQMFIKVPEAGTMGSLHSPVAFLCLFSFHFVWLQTCIYFLTFAVIVNVAITIHNGAKHTWE